MPLNGDVGGGSLCVFRRSDSPAEAAPLSNTQGRPVAIGVPTPCRPGSESGRSGHIGRSASANDTVNPAPASTPWTTQLRRSRHLDCFWWSWGGEHPTAMWSCTMCVGWWGTRSTPRSPSSNGNGLAVAKGSISTAMSTCDAWMATRFTCNAVLSPAFLLRACQVQAPRAQANGCGS